MKTVAIIGSSHGLKESTEVARQLGVNLAKKGYSIVTGAGQGLPLEAAVAAKKAGAKVYGISPAENATEHKQKYDDPLNPFDFLVYTGFGIKGRNVILVRSADAVVMVGGAMGTLNEFTIAYEDGKAVAVLENSGGVSTKIRELIELVKKTSTKKPNERVVFSNDPKELVEKLDKVI
jgi:uncharacterized protein (TIGR00725 family)